MFDAASATPLAATAVDAAGMDGAAPRGRDNRDDLSRDSSRDLSHAVTEIERRIEELEAEIVRMAPLVHERARLIRARAIIMGEPDAELGDQRTSRSVTREDVFGYLSRNPGSRAPEIAAGLDVARSTVSAHLARGKGTHFSHRGGRWYPVPAADQRGEHESHWPV